MDCLHKLCNIIDNYESPYVYNVGDFNANVLRINSVFVKKKGIINSLILVHCVELPLDSFTYANKAHCVECPGSTTVSQHTQVTKM